MKTLTVKVNLDPRKMITDRAITSLKQARALYVADLDGDSDIDVLSMSREDGTLVWYENSTVRAFCA